MNKKELLDGFFSQEEELGFEGMMIVDSSNIEEGKLSVMKFPIVNQINQDELLLKEAKNVLYYIKETKNDINQFISDINQSVIILENFLKDTILTVDVISAIDFLNNLPIKSKNTNKNEKGET